MVPLSVIYLEQNFTPLLIPQGEAKTVEFSIIATFFRGFQSVLVQLLKVYKAFWRISLCHFCENLARFLIYFALATISSTSRQPILWSVAKCRGSRVATKSRGSRVWVVGASAGTVRVKKISKKHNNNNNSNNK